MSGSSPLEHIYTVPQPSERFDTADGEEEEKYWILSRAVNFNLKFEYR